MNRMRNASDISRRHVLQLAGTAALCGGLPIMTVRPAQSTPAMLASAIRDLVGEATVKVGKVKLEIPPLLRTATPCR